MTDHFYQWKIGLDDKLSDEGLLLLKLLYYEDGLPKRELADNVQEPKELYDLATRETESDDTAFAIFHRRMVLLVPQPQPNAKDPVRIMEVKDLGAQACLDHLGTCQLSPPSIQVDHLISSKSKLLECLVMAYVNMSPRKRQDFREQLAKQVGMYRAKFNIFQIVCQLLQRNGERSEEVVGGVVNALNNTIVPKAIVVTLEDQLVSCGIPHKPFSGVIRTKEETKEDYETVRSQPLCTTRMAIHCFVPFIPIVLLVLIITVATTLLHNRDHSGVQEYEVSRQHYPVFIGNRCYNTSNKAPLIRLGTIYSRWYSEVSITQVTQKHYIPEDMKIYAVPSEHIVEHKKRFYCESTDEIFELNIDRLYLLRDSVMAFNICIMSNSTEKPGQVNLTIFDNVTKYINVTMEIGFYEINVEAAQTNCSSYTYVAPNDSFYYVYAGIPRAQAHFANISSYEVEVEMKYVNLDDILNVSTSYTVCYHTDRNGDTPCTLELDDFFSARNYDIFAVSTSPSQQYCLGLVRRKLSFQRLWYAVPAIAGIILIILVFLICVGCSYCVYRKKGRKGDYESLDEQHLIN